MARPGGRGRPRKRLDHLTGDKAYSSRANRALLRARRIRHTIPEPADQKANRARRGACGGRPPAFDRYQATVTVADIFIWLRARPDRPPRSR